MQMPSRARIKAEAVARGFRGADAPARCGGARFERQRWSQQQKRKAAIAGREMQLLAGLEVEPVDHAHDGGRDGRMQRLGNRPQGFFAMRRLDHDHASRIETECVESMSGKPAMAARLVDRHDEDERTCLRQDGGYSSFP